MSLPEPKTGLVIAYAYLWAVEAREGSAEGRKDRPCVIVVATRRKAGKLTVIVAPITHSRPDHAKAGVELSPATKTRLGLDSAPSWVVTDDLNQFTWPGHDLKRVRRGSARFDYGFLPASVLTRIQAQIVDLARAGELALTARE